MANNKKKVDLIYKKKNIYHYLSENNDIYYCDCKAYNNCYACEDPDYIYWQEHIDDASYDYIYTQDGFRVCVVDDSNRARQDKIDIILGVKGSMSNPSMDEIFPNSLRSKFGL